MFSYVGLMQLEPVKDSGIDLEKEYRQALRLFQDAD